jgi:glycosyltransferase involved in cell wall biosynthesis
VLKIAVIADFLEENWPSMDLAAEELTSHLAQIENVESVLIRAPLRSARRGKPPGALERALGRFVQLPIELAARRLKADYYHIADHSYAHLALLFPRDRVGIYCHDIDAFRALLPGTTEPRSRILLSRLLLKGLRHARVVFHSTLAVREEILRHGLVPRTRLVQAPLGVAAEFLTSHTNKRTTPPYLLHVGSCIPRKNIEFLLKVFAAARQDEPELALVQVGGRWTDTQREYLEREGLISHVQQMRGISREELAKIYAGAAVVLVPSLAEGFGLPVIEALACGAPVVASDIPVLREVGFQGVRFCSLAREQDWSRTIKEVMAAGMRIDQETRDRIRTHYTWRAQASAIWNAYTAPLRRTAGDGIAPCELL